MIRTDALMEASLLQHEMQDDVRFGSIADIGGQIAMSALPPVATKKQTCLIGR